MGRLRAWWGRTRPAIVGGLLAAIWSLPLLAGILTTVFYLTGLKLPDWFPGHDQTPAILGPLLALPAWLILGLGTYGFATARFANHSSYGELTARLGALKGRLDTRPAVSSEMERLACQEAAAHYANAVAELEGGGVRWITRLGYITAWQHVHRAEEALLLVKSPTELLVEAVYDELRLTGSTMEHADTIRDMVVASEAFLRSQLGAVAPAQSGSLVAPLAIRPLAAPPFRVTIEAEARSAIQNARYALNQFTDETFAGIVRARNQLLRNLVAAEIAAFLVLELAILADNLARPADKMTLRTGVLAAVAFFLIGALVGVFNRLSVQSQTDTAINDYGLSTTRLIVTPIISGIAGVVGVVLVGVLYSAGLASLINSSGQSTGPSIPNLSATFQLKQPIGLVIAAVFGLTPTLAFDRLNTLTEGYKKDIKSTQASSSSPK